MLKKIDLPTSTPARRGHPQGGLSLVELMIVVGILATVAALAYINISTAMRDMKLSSAYSTAISSITLARERAISTRRVQQVTFTLPGTITITQAATGTVTETFTIGPDVSFDNEPGIPSTTATTPDGFGTGANPIDFDVNVGLGGGRDIFFYPDGSARDAAGNVNNGVLYLARQGDLLSSRAITLYGLTGRLRGWRIFKNTGAATYFWRQQ